MANTWNQGTLARTHDGRPGLPRGRGRVASQIVSAAQRERLLRAVIAAVSETGYAAVTVADIVRRARVSRVAFYAHFADKEDCFLAATREGGQLMFARVASGPRMLPAHAPDEDVLRAGCRAFLAFLASEPAFAKVFYVDMPAAGPLAAKRLDAAARRFADLNQAWHERARGRHPRWPAVPYEAYLALAGATSQLVRSLIQAGRTDDLPGLEDTIVSLHLAVLAARRWQARGPAHQARVMDAPSAPAPGALCKTGCECRPSGPARAAGAGSTGGKEGGKGGGWGVICITRLLHKRHGVAEVLPPFVRDKALEFSWLRRSAGAGSSGRRRGRSG